MSRTVRIGFGVILIVVIATAFLLTLAIANIDRIVERVIETAGTEAAGVTVSVDGVKILVKEGAGSVSGLRIANPPGFKSNFAIDIRTVDLAIDIDSLTKDIIVVDSVQIDSANINYEQSASGSNLQAILDNLSNGSSGEQGEGAGESGNSVKVIIRRVNFVNANAILSIPALNKSRSIEIPEIRLRDIGTDTQGASASELAEMILRPIIENSLSAAVNATGDELKQRLREETDQTLDRGKKKASEKLREMLDR